MTESNLEIAKRLADLIEAGKNSPNTEENAFSYLCPDQTDGLIYCCALGMALYAHYNFDVKKANSDRNGGGWRTCARLLNIPEVLADNIEKDHCCKNIRAEQIVQNLRTNPEKYFEPVN